MFGLSAEAIQYLETVARVSEASTQQIVSEKTDEGAITAQEFVQDQLANNRTELAQSMEAVTTEQIVEWISRSECVLGNKKPIVNCKRLSQNEIIYIENDSLAYGRTDNKGNIVFVANTESTDQSKINLLVGAIRRASNILMDEIRRDKKLRQV